MIEHAHEDAFCEQRVLFLKGAFRQSAKARSRRRRETSAIRQVNVDAATS